MRAKRLRAVIMADESNLTAPLAEGIAQSKRKCCTIGSLLNYLIAIVFLATFVTCLIVIGTIGSLQSHLKGYDPPRSDDPNVSDSRHACYMFSRCNGDAVDNSSACYFKPDKNNECEGTMVGFALIALVALTFIVSSVVKGILNQRLVLAAV